MVFSLDRGEPWGQELVHLWVNGAGKGGSAETKTYLSESWWKGITLEVSQGVQLMSEACQVHNLGGRRIKGQKERFSL